MASTITLMPVVLEGTTAIFSATIVDEQNVGIPGSMLTSLTLTYYDEETLAIINGRDYQNVLQQNNVTVSETGVVRWIMQVGDTQLVDNRKEVEHHIALFTWTWDGGMRVNKQEYRILIENIQYG